MDRENRQPAWPGVELRHFVALAAVAEEASFNGAARRLGYTQSAISHQIATLERILGRQLVDRRGDNGRTTLTAAGRIVEAHAAAINASITAAQLDLQALLESGDGGGLRIGVYESVGSRLVPGLLRDFASAFPETALEFQEAVNDAGLVDAVEVGALDAAFCVAPIPDGPFESMEILSDPFLLVRRSRSPARRRPTGRGARRAPLRIFGEQELLCFRTCRGTELVLDVLRAHRVEAGIAFRSDQNETLLAAAAAGLGAALLPRMAISELSPTLELHHVDELPSRGVAIVWHAHRTRLRELDAFLELASTLGRALAADEQRRLPVPA